MQLKVALVGVERRSLCRDKKDLRIMPAKKMAPPRTKMSEAKVRKNTGEVIIEGCYGAVWSCSGSIERWFEGVNLDPNKTYYVCLAELRWQ